MGPQSTCHALDRGASTMSIPYPLGLTRGGVSTRHTHKLYLAKHEAPTRENTHKHKQTHILYLILSSGGVRPNAGTHMSLRVQPSACSASFRGRGGPNRHFRTSIHSMCADVRGGRSGSGTAVLRLLRKQVAYSNRINIRNKTQNTLKCAQIEKHTTLLDTLISDSSS